jgi:alpha-beta hydrolase superfamily lysophospholipase
LATTAPTEAITTTRSKGRLPRRRFLQRSLAITADCRAADAPPIVVAEEHWAQKGDVKLYLYRKHVLNDTTKAVLFLVHGSSFSGRGGFDLQVLGHPDYSVMDTFARRGFDVWTMDHENYGRSSKTGTNSDIRSGVEDLKAAVPVVVAETSQQRLMFYGQSSGAIRLGVFAMEQPDTVERIVLDAFTYTGEGAPEIMRRRKDVATYTAANWRPMTRSSFQAIFSRDDPSTFEPAVPDALADYELALTDRAPSGTYLDMAIHLPLVDPERVRCPVLITRAETDGNATEAELLEFFSKLPSKDKQFAMIKGIAHVAVLGINRHRIWHVMHAFYSLPPLQSA